MNNLKTTKRALLSSVLALLICFTMLLGTTYAWFTDSAASTNNKIVAGTLDVELWHHTADGSANISDSNDPVFTSDIKWEPNQTETVYLSIRNNGNLELKYKVVIDVTSVTTHKLTDVMEYAITPDAKVGQKIEWAGNGISVEPEAGNTTQANDVVLLPGEEHFFALSLHMKETADNKYMGEELTFDVRVLAGQAIKGEAVYDAEATYSAVTSKTVTNNTVENVIDTDDVVKVTLPVGVATGKYTFEMNNKVVKTDAANVTTVSMDLDLTKDGVKVQDDGTRYLVEIEIGTNKRVIEVTHNGYDVYAYDYDETTGVLSFETTSFSPFAFKFDEKRTVTGLSGTGTEADPYLINDYYDLCWFRDSVNTYTQDGSNQYKGKYVKLTSDIDLAGANWQPIGDNTTNDHEAFMGIFDGDGHTISNLYIDATGDNVGFFARTGSYSEGEQAVVKNLVFENVDVYSNGSSVGGVIGNAGGNTEVRNVTVNGEIYVVGYGYVGGIVGHGYPKMYNCHVQGDGEYSYIICNYWCGAAIVGYAGEGGTYLEGCSVKDMYIFSQYGAAGAVAGLLNAGNTVKDCYAENVNIELGSSYACGYACGNGEESTYDNVSVKNVSVKYNGTELKDIPVDGSGYHNCDNKDLIVIE